MLRTLPARSAILLSVILLGGCGLFRPAPAPVPQEVLPSQVEAGLPDNAADMPPLPPARDTGRTYSITGKNNVFFSIGETPQTVRDQMRESLTQSGYTVSNDVEQPNGFSLNFRKDGKLGSVLILSKAPERYTASFDLPGTFVEVRYDLTPPPLPVLPKMTTSSGVPLPTSVRPPASAFPPSLVSSP